MVFISWLFCFLSFSAQAEDLSEKMLVAPPVEVKGGTAILNGKNYQEPTVANLIFSKDREEEISEVDGRDIEMNLYGAPSSQSYKLSGAGFNGTLKNSGGYSAGIQNKYRFSSGVNGLFLNFDHSRVSLLTPVSLSPGNIVISREFLQAGFFSEKFFEKAMSLKVGYGFLRQVATQTSPSSLASSFDMHGPVVGLSVTKRLPWQELCLIMETLVLVPVALQEKDKTTGDFKDGFTLFSGLHLTKEINKKFSFGLGIQLNTETLRFDDQGTRGTTAGKINFNSISFPINMRYQL